MWKKIFISLAYTIYNIYTELAHHQRALETNLNMWSCLLIAHRLQSFICITNAQYVLLMLKFQWMHWTLNVHKNRFIYYYFLFFTICQCETHFSSSSLFIPHLVTQIFRWFRYICTCSVQSNKGFAIYFQLVVWSRFIFVLRREEKRNTKWNKINNKRSNQYGFWSKKKWEKLQYILLFISICFGIRKNCSNCGQK